MKPGPTVAATKQWKELWVMSIVFKLGNLKKEST